MTDQEDSETAEKRLHGGSDADILEPERLPPEHPKSPENIERRRSLKLLERDEKGRILPGSIHPAAGRPPGMSITVAARKHTDEALAVLARVMRDVKSPPAAQVAAANGLLDRGWGKAPIQIDLNVKAKFDDFLRDVGAAATYIGQCEQVADDEALEEVANEESASDGPNEGEESGA